MKIKYIKVSGEYYYTQEKGVETKSNTFLRYCIITKLSKGRYKIEYENIFRKVQILIAYPSGIEHILLED